MSAQKQRTKLLLDWQDQKARPPRSAYRTCGVRRAMAIGLKEYLEDLSEQFAGQKVFFQKVVADWAEPEDLGKYPAAAIWSGEPCTFDANNFNSYVVPQNAVPGLGNAQQGVYLAQTSEAECRMTILVACSSPEERGLIEAMLEDALVPSDDYYGLGLVLPHYHNELAVYELQSCTYEDGPDTARKNLRTMTFELDAQLATDVLRSYATTTDKTFKVNSDVGFEGIILPGSVRRPTE